MADRYVEGTCPNCKSTQARGDQCENCGTWLNQIDLVNPKCKLCGSTPVIRETLHWYFPLGKYQKRLQANIKNADDRDEWKENVLRYLRRMVQGWITEVVVDTRSRWGVLFR